MLYKRIYKTIAISFCILICLPFGKAQQILIDRGIQAAGLWCFPLHSDQQTYLYLPANARLAINKDSLPEFSYMRYVLEKPEGGSSANTITQADGGGILHFLVLYETPENQITEAQSIIRDRLENDEIRIRGPVVFDKGRYALISSILNPDTKNEERKLLGIGEAPVLENDRIALSFALNPVNSSILLESFKMSTPDVSLVFDMSFSGLTESYEAELEIDWSEVKKSQSFSAGGSIYFVGADVEVGFDEMMKNNAIKLKTAGSDTAMEGLLNTVYSKLLELMFKEVEPERVPEGAQGGLNDAISALTGPNGALGSRNTTGFGINVGYQLKELKSTGTGYLRFNGQASVERHHFITFNAGNLYIKYGKDDRIFRDVPIWDISFKQREVQVGIDGSLNREFNKMVNSVTVKLKKEHGDGSMTTKEILVNSKVYKDSLGKLAMSYLNRGDLDRLEWMNYEYQTIWQFTGGGSYTTDWAKQGASMINLYAPFKRKNIDFEGDFGLLEQRGVRAVSVQIEYPFFNQTKSVHVLIKKGEELSAKGIEITLPENIENVNYTITWIKKDGKLTKSYNDPYGLIFIDELPEEGNTE